MKEAFILYILLIFLILLMMPQATTELGTNGWITSIMQTPMQAAGHNPAWVLVYTSAIMAVTTVFPPRSMVNFLVSACAPVAGSKKRLQSRLRWIGWPGFTKRA